MNTDSIDAMNQQKKALQLQRVALVDGFDRALRDAGLVALQHFQRSNGVMIWFCEPIAARVVGTCNLNHANTTPYACRCVGRALKGAGIVVFLNLQRLHRAMAQCSSPLLAEW